VAVDLAEQAVLGVLQFKLDQQQQAILMVEQAELEA
jgi:hypothetical protein